MEFSFSIRTVTFVLVVILIAVTFFAKLPFEMTFLPVITLVLLEILLELKHHSYLMDDVEVVNESNEVED